MKKFFILPAMLALTVPLAATDNPASRQAKPNVLFVSIDDLNDWIGPFGGHPQAKTPNLDRFHAQGGMVMAKAHAPATVCGPARSAILTGVHSYKTGVYSNDTNLRIAPKARDLTTLPQYFSQHGYHTLSMGKIFHKHPVPGDTSGRKDDQGQWAYDEWHSTPGGVGPISKQRPVNGLPNLPDEKMGYHSTAFDWGPTVGNDETAMQDYKTAQWAAAQFTGRDFDKPFFMALGISKPHLTWYVPQKYFDMYPLEDIVVPKHLPTDLDDILDRNGRPLFSPENAWLRAEKYGRHKEAVRAYLATIAFVDDCIGVLLDGLASSKYADNTIVVLWGDHGWYLGEKMRYGKTGLWQEATRVPLMVKIPGVTPPKGRSDGVVNLIDLYPTLADLCGLPANPLNDGRSFAALLRNPDLAWKYPTLTTMGISNHRIYDGRYSYIRYGRRDGEELYDHHVDPMEWRNLANDAGYAAIKTRLRALIPTHDEPESPRNP